MRIIFLLIFLSLLSSRVDAAKPIKIQVFAEFNNQVSQLEYKLKQERSIVKRYDIFLSHYHSLAKLRSENTRQTESEELNMSIFMEALSYLPEKDFFEDKMCLKYKEEVSKMMTAYTKEQKEPFVEKALGVIDLICR